MPEQRALLVEGEWYTVRRHGKVVDVRFCGLTLGGDVGLYVKQDDEFVAITVEEMKSLLSKMMGKIGNKLL